MLIGININKAEEYETSDIGKSSKRKSKWVLLKI